MKISQVNIRLLEIDARPYYERIGGVTPISRTAWHYPLIELVTDEGLKGYSSGYAPRGEGRGLARILKDCYASEILGMRLEEHARVWERLMARQRHIYGLTEGLVGVVDVALWDLRGKQLDRSICDLIGRRRDHIETYQTRGTGRMTPTQIADDVSRVKASGITGYKLQHADAVPACIEKLKAARDAVGQGYPLMYDAIAAYDVPDAIAIGRALDALNYTWYEEPIPDRQWDRLSEISSQIATPLHHAETLSLAETALIIRQGVGGAVRGDVHIKAGISGMLKLLHMCELTATPIEFHTAASFLLDVANLHIMGSTTLGRFFEVHSPEVSAGFVQAPCTPDPRGMVTVPKGPGLGVDLDWNWIDDHTISIDS